MKLKELLEKLDEENAKVLTCHSCMLGVGKAKELLEKLATHLEDEIERIYIVESVSLDSLKVNGSLSGAREEKRFNESSEFTGKIVCSITGGKKSYLKIVIK